jgi:hypothetical protein
MKSAPCPACGTPDAFTNGVAVECRNARCKFYSAKWAALVQPGGEPFYVPPQIGSGRFAAIAGDLNPDAVKEKLEEEKPSPSPSPTKPSSPPINLRRVVLSKQQRSILFENPGSTRMLWVSRVLTTQYPGPCRGYFRDSDLGCAPAGIWDLIAFSGELEGITVDRFLTSSRNTGSADVLTYGAPLEFYREPSACIAPIVQEYQGNINAMLDVEIPSGQPKFRMLLWGRSMERARGMELEPFRARDRAGYRVR